MTTTTTSSDSNCNSGILQPQQPEKIAGEITAAAVASAPSNSAHVAVNNTIDSPSSPAPLSSTAIMSPPGRCRSKSPSSSSADNTKDVQPTPTQSRWKAMTDTPLTPGSWRRRSHAASASLRLGRSQSFVVRRPMMDDDNDDDDDDDNNDPVAAPTTPKNAFSRSLNKLLAGCGLPSPGMMMKSDDDDADDGDDNDDDQANGEKSDNQDRKKNKDHYNNKSRWNNLDDEGDDDARRTPRRGRLQRSQSFEERPVSSRTSPGGSVVRRGKLRRTRSSKRILVVSAKHSSGMDSHGDNIAQLQKMLSQTRLVGSSRGGEDSTKVLRVAPVRNGSGSSGTSGSRRPGIQRSHSGRSQEGTPANVSRGNKLVRTLSGSNLLRMLSLSAGGMLADTWTEARQEKAVTALQAEIQSEQTKQSELDTLIQHNTSFLAARLESHNDIGSVVSMKQILKCQTKRQQSCRRVKELERLIQSVQQEMTSPQEFQEKLQAILDAEDGDTPADDGGSVKSDDTSGNLSDPKKILERAKEYIAQLETTGEATMACVTANESTKIAAHDDVADENTEVQSTLSESTARKEMLVT